MTDPIVTTTYKTVSVKYTSYGTWQFFASFAVSFGYRAIPTNDKNCKVTRIWFDGVLVYDMFQNLGDVDFIFYPGTEDQPFYRGQMVLFFKNAVLADNGAIPAVMAEIVDDTTLGAIVGQITTSRPIPFAWGDYYGYLAHVGNDLLNGWPAWGTIIPATSSDGGLTYTLEIDIDTTLPVGFIPWSQLAVAQNGAQKLLVNYSPQSNRIVSRFGDVDDIDTADETDFPQAVVMIAQNAGQSFNASSQFMLLSSGVDGDSKWPYQMLRIINNTLAYGDGVGTRWDDEPSCFARGQRLGAGQTAIAQLFGYAAPPGNATGDIFAGFDYSVSKLTAGLKGGFTDTEIYSHDSGVGKIVRIYSYSEPTTDAPVIVLLIETDAGTHVGFARKIAYDGAILWSSSAIDLDSIADKQWRTQQSSSDLAGNKLCVISANTANTYTLISLDDGTFVTGTFDPGMVTIDPSVPTFWIAAQETFYTFGDVVSFVHVDVPGATAIPLDEAITDLAERAGYASEDVIVTGLHDITIQGYIVGSNTTLGDILDNMSTLYQFSYAEVGGKLIVMAVFDGESFTSVATVGTDDLAVLTEGKTDDQQVINTVIADDADMPLKLGVNYIDPDIDYQQGTQVVQRSKVPQATTAADKSSVFTIPIIAHGNDMLARLYRALYATWAAQKTHTIRLPAKYLRLIPTDGFIFTALGFQHSVSAVSVTINADFSVTLNVAERSGSLRLPTVDTQQPVRQPPRGPAAPIRALLLDLPDTSPEQAADSTLNLGVALGGFTPAAWVSGRLDLLNTAAPVSWVTRYQTANETPIGQVIEIDRIGGSVVGLYETDYKTIITIALNNGVVGDWADASYSDMLAGANLIAIGRDARFELLQYGAVVDNGDGTVTISTLMRGRFGTDPVIGMMQVGDYVARHDKIGSVTYPLADFKALAGYAYRGVVPGQDANAAAQSVILPQGISYRLRAPAQLKVVGPQDDGTYDVQWRRRTRFFGELHDFDSDLPPDEGRVFSLDLWRQDESGIALRVASFDCSADPIDHYALTPTQLTTAGYDGDGPEVINVYVYQVDAAHVGRGWGAGFQITVEPVSVFVENDMAITGAMGAISGAGELTDVTLNEIAITGALGAISGGEEIDVAVPPDMSITGAMGVISGAVAMTVETPLDLSITGAMGAIGGSEGIGDLTIDMSITGAMGAIAGSSEVGDADDLMFGGDALTFGGDGLEF